MQFTRGGYVYRLEFQRQHKDITVVRGGKKLTVKSKYPYTTARLLARKFDEKEYTFVVSKEYTVGCHPGDKYSNDLGRKMALRGLTEKLAKDLRTAIWQAYLNRGKEQPKPTV